MNFQCIVPPEVFPRIGIPAAASFCRMTAFSGDELLRRGSAMTRTGNPSLKRLISASAMTLSSIMLNATSIFARSFAMRVSSGVRQFSNDVSHSRSADQTDLTAAGFHVNVPNSTHRRVTRRPHYTNLVFEIGSSRTRFPVAAKMALVSAGTIGGSPGSPTPPGGASLSTIWTSTWTGASLMRGTWNR